MVLKDILDQLMLLLSILMEEGLICYLLLVVLYFNRNYLLINKDFIEMIETLIMQT